MQLSRNKPIFYIMKIYHPPLVPPIVRLRSRHEVEGKVASPLVGEDSGEGYFRVKLKKNQASGTVFQRSKVERITYHWILFFAGFRVPTNQSLWQRIILGRGMNSLTPHEIL